MSHYDKGPPKRSHQNCDVERLMSGRTLRRSSLIFLLATIVAVHLCQPASDWGRLGWLERSWRLERTCIADPDRTLSRPQVTTAAATAAEPRRAVRAELQDSRGRSVYLSSPAITRRSEPFRCKSVTDRCLIRATLNCWRCDARPFSPGWTHVSGPNAIQEFHYLVGNGIRSFASMALRNRSESSSWSKILWPQ